LKNVRKVMDGLQLSSLENKNYTLVIVCVVDTLLKTHGIAFLPEKPKPVAGTSSEATEAVAAPSSEATEAVAAPALKKRASKTGVAAAPKNSTEPSETNAAARLTLLEVQGGEGWLTDDDRVKYGSRLKTMIVRAPIDMFFVV
jgi:hypothetical protein